MVLYVICVHESFFLTVENPSADSQLRICRVFQCILSIVEGRGRYDVVIVLKVVHTTSV